MHDSLKYTGKLYITLRLKLHKRLNYLSPTPNCRCVQNGLILTRECSDAETKADEEGECMTRPRRHCFSLKMNDKMMAIIADIQAIPRPGDGKTSHRRQMRQPHRIAFDRIFVYTRAPGLSFTVELASDLATVSSRPLRAASVAENSSVRVITCRYAFRNVDDQPRKDSLQIDNACSDERCNVTRGCVG